MSQYDFGTIDPNTKDGTALANDLNLWRTALNTNHMGAARPSYVVPGMMWIDDSLTPNHAVYLFDGTQDILLANYDSTTHVYTPAFGGGNVVGPALATDNALARYDLTTGRLIQNSGVTLDDLGAMAFTTAGSRIRAEFSDVANILNRLLFQASGVNSSTNVGAIPNGTDDNASFQVFNAADANNASRLMMYITALACQFIADKTGTGVYLPMEWFVGGAKRMSISIAGVIADGNGVELGYKDVPSVPAVGVRTLATTDRGSSIDTGFEVIVPPNATVPLPVGMTVTVTNTGATPIPLTAGAGVTLRLAGTATVGTRTIAGYGVATLRKQATDTWFVVGAGVT